MNAQIAKASPARQATISQELELAQAQTELFHDSFLRAQRDFQRAGGDLAGSIEQLREAHEASFEHNAKGEVPPTIVPSPSVLVEITSSPSVASQIRALLSLRSKAALLQSARAQALAHQADLSRIYSSLKPKVTVNIQGATVPSAPSHRPAPSPADSAAVRQRTTEKLSAVKALANSQKSLTQLEYSIKDETELASIYSQWLVLVRNGELARIHWLLRSFLAILLIFLFILLGQPALDRIFSRESRDWRRLHALRSVLHFAIRAVGFIAILLVLFGPPSQLGTILAVAGAGLTVALQDYILAFLGWFTLMGKDGIRPGDWVEINGVYGEVLEVGVMHTNLIERGKWSDGSYPTGRKVTFSNSFPIQGHYFNFTTSGHWLWDEIEVTLPPGADASAAGDSIRKIVDEQTSDTAPAAEKEWHLAITAVDRPSFTAEPKFAIRPVGGLVNVRVRYLTPVAERHQIRNRIYAEVVALLHAEPASPAAPPAPTSAL